MDSPAERPQSPSSQKGIPGGRSLAALAGAICTVIGTTRSSAQASIMMGTVPGPASSPRNSVCPGWAKPASIRTDF